MRTNPHPKAAPRPIRRFRPADTVVPAPEAPAPPIPRLLWGWSEIAEATGIPWRTLERELSAGRFPKPVKRVGRRVVSNLNFYEFC